MSLNRADDKVYCCCVTYRFVPVFMRATLSRSVQGGALFMCKTTALISNCRLVENTARVSDGRILALATHYVSLSTLLCCRAVWGGTVRWVEWYVRSRGGITVRVKSRKGAMQFVVSVFCATIRSLSLAIYAGGWGRSAAIQGDVRSTAFDDVPSKLCNKQH